MKLKRILPIVLCLGASMMATATGCSDDNDDDIDPSKVPAEVTATFRSMYPTAKNVEWERVAPWYVSNFDKDSFDTDAWFTASGKWAMTETDYGQFTTFLPAEVQNALAQSEYAGWIVDDVSVYERTADTFCIIEVETAGVDDIALFYDTDGTLLNQVQAAGLEITPNTVISAL